MLFWRRSSTQRVSIRSRANVQPSIIVLTIVSCSFALPMAPVECLACALRIFHPVLAKLTAQLKRAQWQVSHLLLPSYASRLSFAALTILHSQSSSLCPHSSPARPTCKSLPVRYCATFCPLATTSSSSSELLAHCLGIFLFSFSLLPRYISHFCHTFMFLFWQMGLWREHARDACTCRPGGTDQQCIGRASQEHSHTAERRSRRTPGGCQFSASFIHDDAHVCFISSCI